MSESVSESKAVSEVLTGSMSESVSVQPTKKRFLAGLAGGLVSKL